MSLLPFCAVNVNVTMTLSLLLAMQYKYELITIIVVSFDVIESDGRGMAKPNGIA